jgi:hypothetical protein
MLALGSPGKPSDDFGAGQEQATIKAGRVQSRADPLAILFDVASHAHAPVQPKPEFPDLSNSGFAPGEPCCSSESRTSIHKAKDGEG